MFQLLRKISSHILGSITGAITGIAAGFIPGHYYFTIDARNWGVAAMYFFTLPFIILWQIGMGAYTGAREGLLAGLTYPKIVNDRLKMKYANKKTADKLDDYIISRKTTNPLLSRHEEERITALLLDKKNNIDSDKNIALLEQLESYRNYVDTTRCPLTNKPLKNIAKPIVIRTNSKQIICEAAAIADIVQTKVTKEIFPLTTQSLPVIDGISISSKNMAEYSVNSLPPAIAKFIQMVKALFASQNLQYQILGTSTTKLKSVATKIAVLKDEEEDVIIMDAAEKPTSSVESSEDSDSPIVRAAFIPK